jgi:cytochrome P450
MEAPARLLEAGFRAQGDLFALELGQFGRLVIVASPEGVRQVFALSADLYECRPFNEGYRYAMGDHALFLKDGAAHRELKRLLVPLFAETALASQATVVKEETEAVLASVARGAATAVRPLAHEIALRSLLRLVLGAESDRRAEIVALFRERIWRDLRGWKAWTALSRARPAILPVLAAALAARRAAPERFDDMLARLARLRGPDGEPLPDDVLLDQIMMLTITAGDAVAVATAWALERLARHPEAQAQLRAGVPGYLEASCKEVLRLHPVLPTVSGRRLRAPLHFMGYDLAEGDTLAPCEYLVHRRADLFEAPTAFEPARFLGRDYPLGAYFPFGGRERACLGGFLAPLTIRAVIETAVATAALEAVDEEEPPIVRHGTLMAPPEGHRIRFHRLS